jgi:hypothetical protein
MDGFESRWGYISNRATARFFHAIRAVAARNITFVSHSLERATCASNAIAASRSWLAKT